MQEMSMKKIAVAICTSSLSVNGISTVIINYCSHMDLKRYNVTILSGAPIADVYRKTCHDLGVEIVELPIRQKSTAAYYCALNRALSRKKYDIFHVHGNSATIAPEIFLAKLHGIQVRIAHSHNTTCNNIKIHKFLQPFLFHVCTNGLACGKDAGKWLFGSIAFTVLPNGFETQQFKFNLYKREATRKRLKIDDKFVIGHIGRFNSQKNHPFLLEVFKSIAAQKDNAILLLIGNGPDFNVIMKKIEEHPYKNRIIVYGESSDPAALYSAMDVFVLPSKFEGLPVVLLEAQISGLPCVVSDTVTREVDFGNIVWKSLKDLPSSWADDILLQQVEIQARRESFEKNRNKIEPYDIQNCVKQLESFYFNSIQMRGK